MSFLNTMKVLANKGIEGDHHLGKTNSRQVLLMDDKSLITFGLKPGQIRENITVSGIDIHQLTTGQKLNIGEATLEITGHCEPCGRIDELIQGLRVKINGRRGMLCKVIKTGIVKIGDPVSRLDNQQDNYPIQDYITKS